jgi:hypothetical protein
VVTDDAGAHRDVYVHAKMAIVDDGWMTIGLPLEQAESTVLHSGAQSALGNRTPTEYAARVGALMIGQFRGQVTCRSRVRFTPGALRGTGISEPSGYR